MPQRTVRRAMRRRPHRTRVGAAVAMAATAGLAAAPAMAQAASPAPTSLLKVGSSGPNVAKLQSALHTRRTGHFTRGTQRAVLNFQRKDGLIVDGIVGPQTWDTLFGIHPQPTATAPASETGSAEPSAAGGTSGSTGSSGYSIPSSIVQCESGGNYSAVNPSSGAGGAYQILPSTWHAYGGQGLPQDASPAEQSRIASEIYASQGSSAWSCG